MSLEFSRITAELDRLVFSSSDPIVVALKGRWGEGKTYFWKKKVMQEREAAKNSYVSVFGADSLKEIQQRVLLAGVPRTLRTAGEMLGPTVGALIDKAGGVVGIEKVSGLIPESLKASILERFYLRPGMVICLDDIERLSDSVRPEEFLGYVCQLRDDFGLKVVLIYNADEAAKWETFQLYREKVIDREIAFSPDVGDVVELVFGDVPQMGQDPVVMAELVRRCTVLGLKNIRLLLKAKRYHNDVVRVSGSIDQAALASMLYSIVLFVFTQFGRDRPQALTLGFIRNTSEWGLLLPDREKEDENSPRRVASKLLSDYGYLYSDEIDNILADFIETDLLNEAKLLDQLRDNATRGERKRVDDLISAIYQKRFHGSFADTAEELANELVAATRSNMQFVQLGMLDQVLLAIHDLGKVEEAQTLFDEFASIRSDCFAEHDSVFGCKYPPIKERLKREREAAAIDNRSIGEVIGSIVQRGFIAQPEVRRLCQFSKEQLLAYFATERHVDRPYMTSRLKAVVHGAEAQGGDGEFDIRLKQMTRELPKALAGMSRINELRIRAMELDDFLDGDRSSVSGDSAPKAPSDSA